MFFTLNSNDNNETTTTNRRPSDHNSVDSFTNNRYSRGRKAEAGNSNDLTTDRMIHSKINSNLLFYLHGKKIACELYTTIAAEAGLAWKITGGVSAELGEFPWMVSADFFVKLKIFEFCFIRIWEIIGCNKL